MKQLLAHVQIILAGMVLTLLLIDRVNDAMCMIDNDITKGLLFALCGATLLGGIWMLASSIRAQARKRQGENSKEER